MVCPVSATDDAALKIAAAAGLPQRMRVASALHSHTGVSAVACGARRGSLRKPRRDPCSLIYAPPPQPFFGLLHLFETVIVPVTANVHAGKGLRARRMTLTLTGGPCPG